MALLSQADAQRIEGLIAEIEKRTASELVVSVVGRSDDYLAARLAYACAGALMLATLGHVIWPELSPSYLLLAQVPLLLLLFALLGAPVLLRRIAPRVVVHQRVLMRAQRAFMELGVFRTRDQNGVLILLSELEHRAVILGDAGIHRRVSSEGWQRLIGEIVSSIRQGRAADGICKVLNELADTLARDFPVRPDDTNELANRVIIQER